MQYLHLIRNNLFSQSVNKTSIFKITLLYIENALYLERLFKCNCISYGDYRICFELNRFGFAIK